MGLAAELEGAAAAAAGFAGDGEELAAILAAEPFPGRRVYVCAYDGRGGRSWLALDGDGRPLERRADVREAVSIAALCELAAETAGGGALDELRSQLAALRMREQPAGIEEAEEAALALERAVGSPPRLASPGYLDAVGAATLALEAALGTNGASPFAAAMKESTAVVDALGREVEAGYKLPFD